MERAEVKRPFLVNVSPSWVLGKFGEDRDYTIEASTIQVAMSRAIVRFRKDRGKGKRLTELSVKAKMIGKETR